MKQEDINTAFLWPKAVDLTIQQYGSPLYKADSLLEQLEQLISQKKAWAPITGSTKRTEPSDKLADWLSRQHSQKRQVDQSLGMSFEVSLRLTDFPEIPQQPGKRIISTSKNIAYLIDESSDFLLSIKKAFGSATQRKAAEILSDSLGVFVYISNSIESGGRAFSGDPFTGQAAAYSRIFAHDLFGNRVLNYVAYYPHQLYTQFYTRTGDIPQNKGVRLLRSQATLIITCCGILIKPDEWRIMNE